MYFAPGQPAFNHLRHMLLVGWDMRQGVRAEELACGIAHYDTKGRPDDWLFDSFLTFTTTAPSGNFYYADVNIGTTMSGEGDFFAVPAPNPADLGDWRAGLDAQLGSGGFWPTLDAAIADMAPRIGTPPPHARNAVVTIPYPHATQTRFGRIDRAAATPLNFTVTGQNLAAASRQRLEACKWFVDQTIARWKKARLRNLHLLGFYWLHETLAYAWDVDDHWVIKELYKHIRARGFRFFWIPFYSSFNVHVLSDCRDFYFDAAFLQPNHMFYREIRSVKQAVLEARERGAGIEMEYAMAPEGSTPEIDYRRRFRNYLDGGVKYGYMKDSACAWFIGFNDLCCMAAARDPRERRLYHDLHRFVKGTYGRKA